MWEIYNNKHITDFLHILYIYSEVYILKIRVPFYNHGDCEDDWENKGAGCAQINHTILHMLFFPAPPSGVLGVIWTSSYFLNKGYAYCISLGTLNSFFIFGGWLSCA